MKIGRHVAVRHNLETRTVTIEMTEETVLGCYLSGCAFLIGGLIAGCTIWQRSARKAERCECASCFGLYRDRDDKPLGTGGYGEARLVMRQGKPYVLKRVGCETINSANAALKEAACLQRLIHPHVVRFEDVFLHRHDNGGCSVAIVRCYISSMPSAHLSHLAIECDELMHSLSRPAGDGILCRWRPY